MGSWADWYTQVGEHNWVFIYEQLMGNINELITGLVISGPVLFQVVPKIFCIDLYINSLYGLYLRTVGREDPAPSMKQPIVDTQEYSGSMYLPIAQ